MSRRTEPWAPGTPCWTDLAVRDVDRSAGFYRAVLGWRTGDAHAQLGGYVTAFVGDAAVAGLAPQQQPGASAWTLYFATDDARATAQAIAANGGSLLTPPDDVGPLGTLAVASDPTGAVFGLWHGREMIGAEAVNRPGALTWEDLRSPDPAAARRFYAAVFGFVHAAVPDAPADYQTFASPDLPDRPLGGIGGLEVEGQAPHWLVTFGVASAPDAVTAATHHGGAIATPTFDTPFGAMAGIVDPDGAVFWVVETAA